jgi:hypothetical protein
LNKRPVKDVAASVRQKLFNNAKSTNRPFQEVLQYFAMERFLYRLAQSPYADKFVLKGALMFTVWGAPATRPTKDIDFLARTENTIAAVLPIIRAVCAQSVEPDGLVFDETTVEGKNARILMQLDLGYGDVVVPGPKMTDYPVILDLPAPRVRAYSRETVVAEKFEAMVKLGQLNSRLKDFFDVWLLSRQFDFDGATLKTAIGKTFENRKTPIPEEALALTSAFAQDPTKQIQWKGFLRKARLQNAPENLSDVVDALRAFLQPVVDAARAAVDFADTWKAPGPWKVS